MLLLASASKNAWQKNRPNFEWEEFHQQVWPRKGEIHGFGSIGTGYFLFRRWDFRILRWWEIQCFVVLLASFLNCGGGGKLCGFVKTDFWVIDGKIHHHPSKKAFYLYLIFLNKNHPMGFIIYGFFTIRPSGILLIFFPSTNQPVANPSLGSG